MGDVSMMQEERTVGVVVKPPDEDFRRSETAASRPSRTPRGPHLWRELSDIARWMWSVWLWSAVDLARSALVPHTIEQAKFHSHSMHTLHACMWFQELPIERAKLQSHVEYINELDLSSQHQALNCTAKLLVDWVD